MVVNVLEWLVCFCQLLWKKPLIVWSLVWRCVGYWTLMLVVILLVAAALWLIAFMLIMIFAAGELNPASSFSLLLMIPVSLVGGVLVWHCRLRDYPHVYDFKETLLGRKAEHALAMDKIRHEAPL